MKPYFKIFLSLTVFLNSLIVFSQTNNPVQLIEQGRKTSIRGLSVVSNKIIWVSGSAGSVGKSIDGGKTFKWMTIKGYEKRDFRDIEAYNHKTAIIMAVAEPALILKTIDGGENWYKVFEDSTKGMFLDAMHAEAKTIQVIGDPINGKAFFALSNNLGETWETNKLDGIELNEGEAFFASSGTNLQISKSSNTFKKGTFMVTGGKVSRLLNARDQRDQYPLPLLQGKESTGANSIALSPSGKNAFIVGGDFAKDTLRAGNSIAVNLEPSIQFNQPQTPPFGYRSCVIYLTNKTLVACGTSGVDLSKDGGMNWENISTQSFHVVQKAKNGKAVYLAGGNGKIAQLAINY
ncbi:oxidoreductase [Sediminibacterium sp.]|uniref:WD40/YVTN/BNR-like repeat-containing protein n=1 Tax=Sediminibacterium sp. TaxID=1917865 RepID=UPI002732DB82|nr:oxidoreductase [Sediminibacterium sp.]MDP3393602.1 oxidoreductase [Sediminibacterium sp.]MDP3566626.1 oxidoreductase [Sediminibacterium sp.]